MKMIARCRAVGLCMIVTVMGGGVPALFSTLGELVAVAAEPTSRLTDDLDGLTVNAEDMVAHGGMGDAKAILHHCGESARYAGSLLKQVPPASPQRDETTSSLHDVIKYCKRVAEIGVHADPGVLLGPAIKARTAARAAVKALRLPK
ncbi:MAG TPA: hypothetical protein PKD12_01425 [Nitrospira sp.]|nr:hypothetical protein [Nitrospira sp.]